MKRSHLFFVIILAIVVVVIYSMQSGQGDDSYAQTILDERASRDNTMRNGRESPFADNREDFTGLTYFPPDLKYRVVANLEPIERKKVVVLPTSDGKETRYLEYAHATFGMDGVQNRLLILEAMEGAERGNLFLAFADETSADETYGAGRYLDVKKVPGATTITLDFNQAYNPYCAYSDKFTCPFPPKENILSVAIRAGEKVYGL